MKHSLVLLTVAIMLPGMIPEIALAENNSSDGALLAENCQICHGSLGVGSGDIPKIAGHAPGDLVKILTGFRSGATQSTIMGRLVKPLTDAEIAAVAAELATWK